VIAVAALAKAWLATLGMMAVQGGVLVIVALVLTRASRLRPAWQAAIWLVVVLKLALPWSPAMAWSLSDLFASFSGGGAIAIVTVPAAAASPAAPALSLAAVGWLALAALWAAGALVVVSRAGLAHRRTLRSARRAALAPAHAVALLHALAPRSRARLVIGDDVTGPHVVGLLRPTIVVPAGLVADTALLRAALLHELAHVRRGDAIGRAVQVAASALMWWFPLVRFVHRKLDLAREAACDAWALDAGDVSRPAYARLLVRMAALRTADAPSLASHHTLDARIAAVLGPPMRAKLGVGHRVVLAVWFVLALGGARTATARGNAEVCRYTPELAVALFAAYPEADLDGDGQLSRDEVCDLQAELQNASRLSAEAEARLATLLAEPLCCNCDGVEVYSGPETVSCEGVWR
jgi:beta-lactamase regulating signal transducer with metallopeptidase domain